MGLKELRDIFNTRLINERPYICMYIAHGIYERKHTHTHTHMFISKGNTHILTVKVVAMPMSASLKLIDLIKGLPSSLSLVVRTLSWILHGERDLFLRGKVDMMAGERSEWSVHDQCINDYDDNNRKCWF